MEFGKYLNGSFKYDKGCAVLIALRNNKIHQKYRPNCSKPSGQRVNSLLRFTFFIREAHCLSLVDECLLFLFPCWSIIKLQIGG